MHHIVFWLFFSFLLQMGVFSAVSFMFFFLFFFLITKAVNRRRLISPMWPFQSDIILLANCHLLPHHHRVCWLEFYLQCSVCFWILEASLSKKKEKKCCRPEFLHLRAGCKPRRVESHNTLGFLRGGSVYLSDLLSFCSVSFSRFQKIWAEKNRKKNWAFVFLWQISTSSCTEIPPTFSCFFCRWKRTKQPWF